MRSPATKVLVDTGPLVAAMDRREASHPFAAELIARLRRNAIVPTPVLVEVDHLLRGRAGSETAGRFLQATVDGERDIAYLSAGLLRRAVELDDQYADLNLGFVDTCVMAIAERHKLLILTFDFADFRATESANGPWPLLIGEDAFRSAIGA
ncbi:MAG TPA: PIN domain-containing protein [Solirubrobacterales bacterium]|nr:PIN domain-containing protein [Solirubrobacterales bacterium]